MNKREVLEKAKQLASTALLLLLVFTVIVQQAEIQSLSHKISQASPVQAIQTLPIEQLNLSKYRYHGNPFVTSLWPGQLQAENITFWHLYQWTPSGLVNKTDILTYPIQEANYIIYVNGSLYYAKNGLTGQIQFSGTDAGAVIQNAINNLPSGGLVLIKEGTYNIVTTIQLKSNITISGEGTGTVLLRSPTPSPSGPMKYAVFYTSNASNVVLQNLVVDGNKYNLPWINNRWDYEAIVFSNSQNIIIRNIIVRNVKVACGIDIISTQYFTITNSIIYNNGDPNNPDPLSDAIHTSRSEYGVVSNNIIYNVTDTGVACDNSQFITVSGNVFYSCGAEAVAWYNVYDTPIPRGLVVTNNIMLNNGRGVWVSLASGLNNAPEDVIIADNYMYTSYILIDKGYHVLITGNRIRFGNYGIVIHGGYNIMISGNQFTDTSYGVYNDVHVDELKIINNIFIAVGTPVQIVYGIVRYNYGYTTENRGGVVFSGDGTTKQFKIAHGLVATPSRIFVTPGSSAAAGSFYVTADSTYIYVNYVTAPPAGTNNIVLYWYAEV